MPREDEFNQIKVTNERQLHGFEFGNTQNTEFSFQNVKKNGINNQPNNELNEEIEEVKVSRRPQKDIRQEQDLIEQATESSNASAPTTTSTSGVTASSSSASAAASSSSAAAASSGASAAAASTAAAAGTVVVAAFAVVSAAPVILSNASAFLSSYEASAEEIYYEVKLEDTVEDEHYIAILSNETYEQKQTLDPTLDVNIGSFEELEPENEYTFEVIEGNESLEITRQLLTQQIKTSSKEEPAPEKVSEFRSFIFDKTANYSQRTFDVQLDFIDEKGIFSEFKFTLNDGEQSYTYTLDKKIEVQHLPFDIDEEEVYFEPYNSFLYEFSYLENGEKKSISSEERFSFTDTSGAESVFTSASLVQEVDFLGTSLTVVLDFTDPLGIFSNFQLHLSYPKDNGEVEKVYALDELSGSQVVPLEETLPFDSAMFTYYFSYTESGETRKTDPQTIQFTDTLNRRSSFDSAEVNSDARFDDGLIYVNLSYVDELNKYDQVTPLQLELSDATGAKWVYDVQWQVGSQSIILDAYLTEKSSATNSPVISRGDEFSYVITCTVKNSDTPLEVGRGTVTFSDSSKISEFYGATVNSTADLKENFFYVTLSYVDSLSKFQSVEVVLTTPTGGEFVYDLDFDTEEQGVNASTPKGGDTGLTLDNETEYTYTFRYYEVGNENPITISTGQVTFGDPTIFTLTDLSIGTADFANRTFFVQISYTGNIERDVYYLELELNDPNSGECNYSIDLSNLEQTKNVGEDQDLEHGIFSYTLRQYRTADDVNPITIASGTNLQFTDIYNNASALTDFSFIGSSAGHADLNSVNGQMGIQLSYDDYFDYYQSFNLTISEPEQGGGVVSDPFEYTFESIEKQTDPQVLTVPEELREEILTIGTFNYSLTYVTMYSDEREEAFSGQVTFVDNATDQIVGINYGDLVYSDGSYYLPFKFSLGEKYETSNLSVRITDNTGGSTYLIQMSDNGSAFNDDLWQYAYFSSNDINSFMDSAENIEVYYDDGTEHVLYSEPVALSLKQEGGDFSPYGMRFNEYITSDGFTVRYFLYDGEFGMFNGEQNDEYECHLKFIFEDSSEYEDCYFTYPGGYGYSFMVSCEDDALQAKLEGAYTCEVYLVYVDGNDETQELLIYTNFSFSV